MYFKSSAHACALLLSALKTNKQTKQSNLSRFHGLSVSLQTLPFSLSTHIHCLPLFHDNTLYITTYCYSGSTFPLSLFVQDPTSNSNLSKTLTDPREVTSAKS